MNEITTLRLSIIFSSNPSSLDLDVLDYQLIPMTASEADKVPTNQPLQLINQHAYFDLREVRDVVFLLKMSRDADLFSATQAAVVRYAPESIAELFADLSEEEFCEKYGAEMTPNSSVAEDWDEDHDDVNVLKHLLDKINDQQLKETGIEKYKATVKSSEEKLK